MKGGVAAFAAAAIDFLGAAQDFQLARLSFLITNDEEGPSINGTNKVLEWTEDAEYPISTNVHRRRADKSETRSAT